MYTFRTHLALVTGAGGFLYLMKDPQGVRSGPLALWVFVEGLVYVEIEVTAAPAGTAEVPGVHST